jgi:hypothetical protein
LSFIIVEKNRGHADTWRGLLVCLSNGWVSESGRQSDGKLSAVFDPDQTREPLFSK